MDSIPNRPSISDEAERAEERELVRAMHREAVRRFVESPPVPTLAEPPTIHYSELVPAAPDSPLYREWETYRQHVGRLLSEGHEGRHVLIKGDQILGIYETGREAKKEGLKRYLLDGFLVHQIQTRERVLRQRITYY